VAEDRATSERLAREDLEEGWVLFSPEDRVVAFQSLPRPEAEDFFLSRSARDEAELLLALPSEERRSWIRLLPPDDAADLVQAVPPREREGLLALLDDRTRMEVTALLAYAEDEAGGLMNPRFARVRPEMTADEAISYLRKQARERSDAPYTGYCLDDEQRLLGVVTFRDLFAAPADKKVREIMHTDVVTVREDMDQEEVSRVFAESGFFAIPVVDAQFRMKGIVTADDIVEVVEEEATEDIQKFGGVEVLGAPYLEMGFPAMVRKRAGWLAALFVGEMLTATAMAFFEAEIARAVVLAVFLPLIISSGGNSGSQASTLVIRAMALGELKLSDALRVARRELVTGLSLGAILATIGVVRIFIWQGLFNSYGPITPLLAATVGLSVVGCVSWGTFAGSLMPLVIRRLGFDPASASAPFIATLVDVSGVVIYFTTAKLILGIS
jgi:magnesium transporter